MQLSLKKITTGLGAIVFVGALVIGATGAFFSDTETSTGNTFSAGAIDLQIDNTSYVTDALGNLVFSSSTSWGLANLTNQLFFNFTDVKPGDIGEDTISIHAGSNNAYACMAAKLTATPENTVVDPEIDAGDSASSTVGELQNFLNFSFWNDDGDNVLETGETIITPLTGPASTIFDGTWRPIADTSTGSSSVIIGNSTRFIGKAWCFGTLTPAPLPNTASTSPLVRGTGFTCNGAGNNNIAQTDGINVDVSFQAVQARNNGQFLCSSLPPLGGATSTPTTTPTTLTVNKVLVTIGDQTPPATTTFAFKIDGGATTTFEGDGSNLIGVLPGSHTITELVTDPDYTASFSGGCSLSTSTPRTSNPILVATSTNATCTITNTFNPL
ncbi:M73 family metallopeptidase [Candidatus Parcubacteria bacterium]|nr:M73 family metallopeptidase [Candidatus Parcubacteria bacterium]